MKVGSDQGIWREPPMQDHFSAHAGPDFGDGLLPP